MQVKYPNVTSWGAVTWDYEGLLTLNGYPSTGVFFTASVILGIAPGPDNIFVLTQSALNGRMAGVIVTLGLCTGLLIHTAAIALGVAALVQASTLSFTLLKLIGAGYLLFLAWQVFTAGASDLGTDAPPTVSA